MRLIVPHQLWYIVRQQKYIFISASVNLNTRFPFSKQIDGKIVEDQSITLASFCYLIALRRQMCHIIFSKDTSQIGLGLVLQLLKNLLLQSQIDVFKMNRKKQFCECSFICYFSKLSIEWKCRFINVLIKDYCFISNIALSVGKGFCWACLKVVIDGSIQPIASFVAISRKPIGSKVGGPLTHFLSISKHSLIKNYMSKLVRKVWVRRQACEISGHSSKMTLA